LVFHVRDRHALDFVAVLVEDHQQIDIRLIDFLETLINCIGRRSGFVLVKYRFTVLAKKRIGPDHLGKGDPFVFQLLLDRTNENAEFVHGLRLRFLFI